MFLIVGLGNPGEKYDKTWHNAGFLAVETFAKKNDFPDFKLSKKFKAGLSEGLIGENKIILAKPQTFMNDSGVTVSKIASFYKIKTNDIYVIHDDLDIRLGEYKIQKGVGPQLHYGIQSIESHLGNLDFWRVRVGVDNRDLKNRIPGEEYVLKVFNDSEREILDKTVEKLLNDLIKLVF